MEFVLILIVLLFVVYKLGLFAPVLDLTNVATRESAAYNREHKEKVGLRYENMSTTLDVDKINENIKRIDALNFD